MKKALFAVVLFAATAALAATKTTTWTGNGADNKWSNAANWSAGVPDASVNQPAEIGLGDYEIEIDGEKQEFYSINLVGSSTVNAGTLTLTGSGRLYTEGSGSTRKFTIGAGRRLVLDGPSFYVWNYEQKGEVLVKSGTFNAPGKEMELNNGATFVVDGGTFDASEETVSITNGAAFVVRGGTSLFKKFYLNGEGEFRVLDGTVSFKDMSMVSFAANAIFQHTGGTISRPDVSGTGRIWKEQMNKNATLEARSVGDKAAHFKMTTTNFYEMAGTLVATNGGVRFAFENQGYVPMTFSGRGAIVANKLSHDAKKSSARLTFDLSSLTLGAGGILGVDYDHYDYLDFQNGITFGAYGDWSQADNEGTTTHLVLSGPVTFNTRDAFDGVTSHTMSLKNVNLSDATALKVVGGGTVNLTVETGAERLRALTVSDASTLSFQTNKSHLCVDTATIGSGATLTLAPDKRGYLDVVESASLAAGSVKLEFSDPAFATNRCPVYFAPAGTEADLAAFDATDVPTGLSLAKRENVVYLTDDSADANDTSAATADAIYWTGDVSGSWQDADNWTSKKAVTTDAFGEMHFRGWKNMVMTNSTNQARPSRITVDAGCGPVWVRGSAYFRFNYANAIFSYSDNPLIIEATVGTVNGNYFGVNNCGNSYVALTGGAYLTAGKNANTNRIVAVGDVRLGGVWRFNRIELTADTDQKQPTRLTLLPGATLTTIQTSSSVSIVKSAGISVAAGANLTMNNAKVSFSESANTHFVDGTWTVNCPFKAASRQTFRGTGMLKLVSLAAAEGGIEVADSLTLVPGDWDEAVRAFFRETPTVKTETATTIGAAVTFELEPHATVTFDTTDGNLTMETPILGGGDIVKTGSGKLILDTADSVIDTLTIAAGSVEPGPALVAEADAGFVPFLTVKKLVGDLTLKNAKVRATVNADGTTTYSFKNRHGLMLIVR